MNKVVVALLFVVIVLAYGGYYYREYFVMPESEPIVESESNNNTSENNNDSTPDIEPVQMEQYLDLDNLESTCNVAATCGDLVGVNCHAEVDGPYFYVNKNTEKIIAYCGGYCFNPEGCPNACPPKEWTCN